MAAEELGIYVLMEFLMYFPKADGILDEPEGTKWMCPPLYTDPNNDYYGIMHAKCRPKSLEP